MYGGWDRNFEESENLSPEDTWGKNVTGSWESKCQGLEVRVLSRV